MKIRFLENLSRKIWILEMISRLCTRRLNNYLKTQLIKAQAERKLKQERKFSRFRRKKIRKFIENAS